MFETMAVEIEQLLGKVTRVTLGLFQHLGNITTPISVTDIRSSECGC